MKAISSKTLCRAIVLAIVLASPVLAQNTHIEIAKHSRAIPKSCELVTPAAIDGAVDVPALVKEAICKGAGDMMGEYTYTVNSVKREKNKKGKVKEESFVYEVFIPTLKSGTSTKGVLVVTSHNGVVVPANELDKDRLQAAEKIEKEEERIARAKPLTTNSETDGTKGMLPLGMYTRTSVTRSAFGVKSGGVTLAIADFLRASELTFARREQIGGRDTLIFNFTPRPGTEFIDNEKYMAQLSGEIWIDATDRIVTRLSGWPTMVNAAKGTSGGGGTDKTNDNASPTAPTVERSAAVFMEMMRLPQPGIWLPHVIRINGADYQKLFDGITTDSISTYSNYIRFSTEVKDVEVAAPKNP
jgi:hypothetical protein